jgi:hypothetical protein
MYHTLRSDIRIASILTAIERDLAFGTGARLDAGAGS